MKRIFILTALLLAPARGFAAAIRRDAALAVIGEATQAPLELVAAKKAPIASVPVADIRGDLDAAIRLRQQIRDFLRTNGIRATQEQILSAQYHQAGISGSILFGIGGISGGEANMSLQGYKPLLDGGETYLLASLDPSVGDFIDQLKAEAARVNGEIGGCNRALLRRLEPLRSSNPDLAALGALFDQLRTTLDRLELTIARGQEVDRAQFAELRKWGANSLVLRSIVKAGPFKITTGSTNGGWVASAFVSGGPNCENMNSWDNGSDAHLLKVLSQGFEINELKIQVY